MPISVQKLQFNRGICSCPICNERGAEHIKRVGEDSFAFSCDANATLRTERQVFEMYLDFGF